MISLREYFLIFLLFWWIFIDTALLLAFVVLFSSFNSKKNSTNIFNNLIWSNRYIECDIYVLVNVDSVILFKLRKKKEINKNTSNFYSIKFDRWFYALSSERISMLLFCFYYNYNEKYHIMCNEMKRNLHVNSIRSSMSVVIFDDACWNGKKKRWKIFYSCHLLILDRVLCQLTAHYSIL